VQDRGSCTFTWFLLDDESQKLAQIRDYLLPKLLSDEIPVEAAEEWAGHTASPRPAQLNLFERA
jgi:hypothetical protein